MTKFEDLADLPEDERIKRIGRTVMLYGRQVAFSVDSKPADKVERYKTKLLERFKGILILKQVKGPVQGTVTVIVGPPKKLNLN